MSKKGWLILLSVLSLLALFALASGLRGLDFQPGRSYGGGGETLTLPFSVNDLANQVESVPLWQRVVLSLALLLNVWLFARFLPPEMRKRLLLTFVRITLFAWGFFYLVSHNYIRFPDLQIGNPAQVDGGLPGQAGDLDRLVFHPPQLASWTTYLISLAVVLLLIAAAWRASRAWTARRPFNVTEGSLEEIGRIARSSLDDLSAGGDWEDLIVQAYARMAEAVDARRRLRRSEAMTPREFAGRLERAGLPRSSVYRLTSLFESVRYGGHRSSQADASEAAACLSSILQYCQEAA